MIVDTIQELIERFRKVRALEEIKANNKQQQDAEKKYRILVNEIRDFVQVFVYARDQLFFSPSERLENELASLLPKLKEMVREGTVDIDMAKNARKRFNRVKCLMAEDWKSHFSKNYGPTIGTLRVIEGISADRARKCLTDIDPAETWSPNTSTSTLKKLARGLNDSSCLIRELELDDNVVCFLQKMTSGDARVSDLTHDLMLWMKKEGIEDKVSLSFIS